MQDPVSEEAVADLLSRLVAIPSINPALRRDEPVEWFGEQRIARFVQDWLAQAGIEAALDEVEPGRPNVVAQIGAGRGPRMIWEGHLDTVQVAGMTIAPFTPEIRNGRIFGRGAVDDKGCLAMFMLAMQALQEQGAPLDLTFVAAMDEEATFKGVSHHINRSAPYDFGIAGEPTSLGIVTACKGVIRWKVTIVGKAAHTSTPNEGIDAGTIGRALIQVLQEAVAASARRHPLLGLPTFTCTRFEAGEGFNTVPARAELAFDYRLLPDRTGPEAWDELHAVVQHFAKGLPRGAGVEMHPPFVDSISMEVPAEHGIVRLMQDVCGRFKLPKEVRGVPFGSDATKLTRAGTPTIVFGPGSIEQAHTADEYVELSQVAKAANMLVELVKTAAT